MKDWKPIATAPKDIEILVRDANRDSKPVIARHAGGGAWIEVREDGSSGGTILPTHWKPRDQG